MNNWMSRIAIFAVLGAVLSSAVLVGCGGNSDDANTTTNSTTKTTTKNAATEGG